MDHDKRSPQQGTTDDEGYVPVRDARFYPGQLSRERQEKLLKGQVPGEELTVDDLVFFGYKINFLNMFNWIGLIRDRLGEQAALEVIADFGYRLGRARYKQALENLQTDGLTTEQMAYMQDYWHSLMGPEMMEANAWWDDDLATVKRTNCAWFASAPEGMKHYCLTYCDNSVKGYMELQPGLRVERIKHLPKGDPYCQHVFHGLKRPPKRDTDAGKVPFPRRFGRE